MHVGEMENYFEFHFVWWRLGPVNKKILFYWVLRLFPLSQNSVLQKKEKTVQNTLESGVEGTELNQYIPEGSYDISFCENW